MKHANIWRKAFAPILYIKRLKAPAKQKDLPVQPAAKPLKTAAP